MNKRVKITSFAAAALATLFLAGINGHSTRVTAKLDSQFLVDDPAD